MTTLPHTQDEILARINARQHDDPLGFEYHEYIMALEETHAERFLKPKDERGDDPWKPAYPDVESVRKTMEDYVDFAWEKANNCRGISANRSVQHYIAWAWLIGDTEFSAEIERMFDEEYRWYGKAILVAICEKYGWDWRARDNDRWVNDEYDPRGITAAEALGL